MSRILVTGAAGFIGSATSRKLLEAGAKVVGVDNLNDSYDRRLKRYRLKALMPLPNFTFYKADIERQLPLSDIFRKHKFDAVIHHAARTGVRHSLQIPDVYFKTNVLGTLNLFERMRKHNVRKMVLASSSSLYDGKKMPFTEDQPVNTPTSPYAVTKKAAEVLAYSYHNLFEIDVSILRYFTVYGPAGRPDMSYFRFIKRMDEGQELILYGNGRYRRDFTYIDDIVDGTVKALKPLGYEIINLGNNHPCSMLRLITIIEKALNKQAGITRMPVQKADLPATWADISKAKKILGWIPKVSLEEGIEKTVRWHTENRSLVRRMRTDL